ncbi:esterase-like activity of phytase family protein [Bacteriovorax sp. PP10]|uniref:Esterase-like activity of phytase family protein n=1 Tax=Bacteriovorax antarcticus TaxID=3088717 RepID=A0ABU5VWB3_9BACT|nr:esterase-like activity of phytase family protein [Bacteriovorax sp. PP10]MEA9356882.1 esterase-like activity of phytase family protein [Bacteriovorax sp. PP10]
MTRIIRFFLVMTLLCTHAYATDTLRFIGDVNINTGTVFQGTEIGGLSGITYDRAQNKLLAISDDKSWVNETRFYEFDIKLTAKSFAVTPSKVVKLKQADGTFYKKNEADFEGISLYGKDILISSEGSIRRSPPTSSELYLFGRDGSFKQVVPVPEKFLIPKTGKMDSAGARDNKGFEALSTTLDGKTTFMAAEDALIQDGEISSISNASTTRIVIYKDLKPVSEVAYTLEKIEALKSINVGPSDNGVVDIAAIDDKNFYIMERSWIARINKNIIRIFKCSINDKTTDVSKIDSLKSAPFTPVEKVLVLEMDDFIDLMNPKVLDNIEGISFGPILPNGNRTLIVVSDNNFNSDQRTLFLAVEILNK